MRDRASRYISLMVVLGAMAGLALLTRWHIESPLQFGVYLFLGLITSGWKVTLPGIPGTMSANFLYVILSVLELSLGEALVLGGLSVLVQYAWKARSRFDWHKASFNVASIWIAVTYTESLVHSAWLESHGVTLALRLVLGAGAYFLGNTLSISFAIAASEGKPGVQTWKECYFWSFPYYLVGGALAGGIHWSNQQFGWQASILLAPAIYIVYRSYSLYLARMEAEKRRAEDQKRHAEEMVGLHLRTIEALALAIDAKDETTHDHLQRVRVYCLEMGRLVGLTKDEMDALQAASLLHDIGKLAVPEHIISKPGKLTPEEFEKIKIHPVVGAEILERVRFPYPVVPIVRHHHEAWDGSGYPDGLKGEEIPIGARILSVVDCLDALASDRQYRKALPLDEAMKVVESESGRRYDPRIVQIMRRHYLELEKKARAAATPGELRLHRDIRIARGLQPAAGFAAAGDDNGFLKSIGAARREAQLVFEMTQVLVKSLSLPEMLAPVAQRLRELVPFENLAILALHDGTLSPIFVSGDRGDCFSGVSVPFGEGLSGWVAQNRKPIVNGNPMVECGYDPGDAEPLRSALALPLEGSQGILGTLALYSAKPDAFSQDHLRILLGINSRIGLAIENNMRFRRVEDEAQTDFLTGLHNPRSLFERLKTDVAEAAAQRTPMTVMVADLDHFKTINDRFGHLAGNQLLQTVSAVLQRHCRTKDYAGRMGGDEFVVAFPGLDPANADALAERICDAVTEAASAVVATSGFSISIGWAATPEDGSTADALLAEADRRMYLHKQRRPTEPRDLITLSDALSEGESRVEVEQAV